MQERASPTLPPRGGEQTLSPRDPATKLATWPEAERWKAGRKGRVAFTNGVFDLLHTGHIDVLTAARNTADALVVGINSDESVRRLKGPSRPVRTDMERAYVVAALECVDLVVVFPEDTPLNLVKHLKPDVIVKGGDYAEATIVGASEVKSWGGKVVVVPLTHGHSTTAIIRKLNETR
ncbi:MAG: D-glycero-beta-D-manno-heptose 1-phosphate adenylyltransferase [Gemmatimonadaceae bacterium]